MPAAPNLCWLIVYIHIKCVIFVWLVLNLAVIIVDGAIQDLSKCDANAERADAVVGMYRQIIYIKVSLFYLP